MELMVTDSDVVEQAKGFLREILDISMEDAYGLLRRYAQVHGDQQVRVSARLMSEPGARPAILAAMRQMLAGPCC
jgi:AmiR/NasT family two-component response regulator